MVKVRLLLLVPLFAASALLPNVYQVRAQESQNRVTLRGIMRELGIEYLRLSNALMVEDFKSLDSSAKAIRVHPFPADIVDSIRRNLTSGFREFERTDEQTHEAATELSSRAAAKDILGSAKAFEQLTNGCVSCHHQFRASLRSLSD